MILARQYILGIYQFILWPAMGEVFCKTGFSFSRISLEEFRTEHTVLLTILIIACNMCVLHNIKTSSPPPTHTHT